MPGLEMKYFVLQPNGKDAYAIASREAMRRYAEEIAADNPALSDVLLDWANREQIAAAEMRGSAKP